MKRYACVIGGGIEEYADGELTMYADAKAEIDRLTREMEEAKRIANDQGQQGRHANRERTNHANAQA